ncbi:MAG: peroxiredoxin [Hyphomicrobiaceae bacterium]
MIEAGGAAPGFSLPGDDGKTVSLTGFKGKPVVLYFYPKDDTSGCTREALDFTADAAAFRALGAVVVGVSPDGVKSHQKFKQKHALDVLLVADEEKSLAEAYGVWVEKSMYGRKYMGVDRSTFLIDGKGKVVNVWRKVKVPGHVAEVLEAVKALAK